MPSLCDTCDSEVCAASVLPVCWLLLAAFGWGWGHGHNSYIDDVVIVVKEDCKDDKCKKKCDKDCGECDVEMCDKCEQDDDKCYRKYFCDKCEKKVRGPV